ncbi:MAG: hypothetical protein IKH54_06300 [Bacilli bacterium]|nr:hypothetical protein [Bacilli bacterium]MBR6949773.1 hypothetical protein [Bacilli bacterium]
MKVLRKILVFILGFILYNLVCALILTFALKDIVQTEMIGGVVRENILPAITESEDVSSEEKEQIQALLEDEGVNEVINEVVGDILNTFGDENATFDQESIDKIFDYVIDNKEQLEKAIGKEIDTNEIEKFRDSQEYSEFTGELSKTLNEAGSSLDSSSRAVIRTYNYIVSDNFKIALGIIIFIDLLLIMLIQWSLYKWLAILGRALYTSGITVMLMYLAIKVFINKLLVENGINITIDTSNIFLLGIGSLILGIILVIIFKIINKAIMNKEKSIEEPTKEGV